MNECQRPERLCYYHDPLILCDYASGGNLAPRELCRTTSIYVFVLSSMASTSIVGARPVFPSIMSPFQFTGESDLNKADTNAQYKAE